MSPLRCSSRPLPPKRNINPVLRVDHILPQASQMRVDLHLPRSLLWKQTISVCVPHSLQRSPMKCYPTTRGGSWTRMISFPMARCRILISLPLSRKEIMRGARFVEGGGKGRGVWSVGGAMLQQCMALRWGPNPNLKQQVKCEVLWIHWLRKVYQALFYCNSHNIHHSYDQQSMML